MDLLHIYSNEYEYFPRWEGLPEDVYKAAKAMDEALDASDAHHPTYDDDDKYHEAEASVAEGKRLRSAVLEAQDAFYDSLVRHHCRFIYEKSDPRYSGLVVGKAKQGYYLLRDNGERKFVNTWSMSGDPHNAIRSRTYPESWGTLTEGNFRFDHPDDIALAEKHESEYREAFDAALEKAKSLVGRVVNTCVGERDCGMWFSNVYNVRRVTGYRVNGSRIYLSHEGWDDDFRRVNSDYVNEDEVGFDIANGDELPDAVEKLFYPDSGKASGYAEPKTFDEARNRALWIVNERGRRWQEYEGRDGRLCTVAANSEADSECVWLLLEQEDGMRVRDLVFDGCKWINPMSPVPGSDKPWKWTGIHVDGRIVDYGGVERDGESEPFEESGDDDEED